MSLRIFCYLCLVLFLTWFSSVISAPYLFKKLHFSPVLYCSEGDLLAAKVSLDGQWRFPVSSEISNKYVMCLKRFEDRRFDDHFGIDPFAILRATYQNIRSGEIKSGGSTITMQLARLLLKNPPRTLWNKLRECWIAIGLEFNFNKSQLIKYYATVAPYGGNVVGLDAAIWRYFQRSTPELSWAEAALLAVLPNQPSYIHLEKNRDALLKKRNTLLFKLFSEGMMDKDFYELSLLEPIPQKIFSMPQSGNLLLEYLMQKYPDQYSFRTTINGTIHQRLIDVSKHYAREYKENEIHNMAILLIDNRRRSVLSYIANTTDTSKAVKNARVNNIHSPRSSGSILKPILYAAALDRGLISPQMLIPDVPTLIAGFRPENFTRKYSGAITVKKSIQQSLNVPAVRLLQSYGLDLFYKKLVQCGFDNLFRPSEEYGLSLILGGAEVTAWDLGKVYSGFAYQLLNYNDKKTKGLEWISKDPDLVLNGKSAFELNEVHSLISNAAIYDMIQMMQGSELPEALSTHFYLQNKNRIAWKTGTSFGFKDAWCVGITPEYTMVVWVGNSSGLGRPGLIGVYTAAPMMFELFQSLPYSNQWLQPFDEMHRKLICKQSGYVPSQFCNQVDTVWISSNLSEMNSCPYHQLIYLDSTKRFRVFQNCDYAATPVNWFSLPPVMEFYYKPNHPEYKTMPEIRADCLSGLPNNIKQLEFIYPDKGVEVFIPVDLDELSNKIILKAAHKNSQSTIYWFMDDSYLGSTESDLHEWSLIPAIGTHKIKIADESGQSATATITCYRRTR